MGKRIGKLSPTDIAAQKAQATTKTSELFRNVVLYGIFGCLASGTDVAVFYALAHHYSIAALQANMISMPIGILVSFLLNRRFNFKVTDHALLRSAMFFGVGIVGLCLSQTILWLGVKQVAIPLYVKLFSIVIVGAVQFAGNKLITFGVQFK